MIWGFDDGLVGVAMLAVCQTSEMITFFFRVMERDQLSWFRKRNCGSDVTEYLNRLQGMR